MHVSLFQWARALEYCELLAKCLCSRIDWLFMRVNYIKFLSIIHLYYSLTISRWHGFFFYEIDLILLILKVRDYSWHYIFMSHYSECSGDTGSQEYSLINFSPSYASVQSRHAIGFSCLDRLCYIAIGEYQTSDQTCSATWLSFKTWNFRILSRADLN